MGSLSLKGGKAAGHTDNLTDMTNVVLAGRYRIVRQIGQGGTGRIFLAWDLNLNRQLALKCLRLRSSALIPDRHEADMLKNLHHSNLPQVYDFFCIGQDVYTAEEYISGSDLAAYLGKNGQISRLPEAVITGWLWQLCDVLEYLHTRSTPIIHSDIKPGNIMITPEGRAMLIDFNISLLQSQKVLGFSNWYASPEQVRQAELLKSGKGAGRSRLDARSDIYSLAATFYRLISGRTPALGAVNPPLVSMNLPYSPLLLRVLDTAMAYDPAKRYKSARQMKQALAGFRRQDRAYRKQLLQRAAIVVAGCALAAAGIVCICVGCGQNRQHRYDIMYEELAEAEEAGDAGQMIELGKAYRNSGDKNSVRLAEAYAAEGEGYFQQERYGLAADRFGKACEYSDSSDYALRYLVSLARNGDYAQLQSSIDRYPQLSAAAASVIEAQCCVMRGEYEQALEIVDSAERGNSIERLNLYDCGAAAADELGQYELEAEYLAECRAIKPTVYYISRYAQACYLAEDYSDALEAYRQLVQLKPGDTEYFVMEVMLGHYTGSYTCAQARTKLESVLPNESDPASLYVLYMNLAFVCYEENPGNTYLLRDYCTKAIENYNLTDSAARRSLNDPDLIQLAQLAYKIGCTEELEDGE